MQATMDEVRGGAELFLCALGYPGDFHPRWFAQEHFEDGSYGIFFPRRRARPTAVPLPWAVFFFLKKIHIKWPLSLPAQIPESFTFVSL
jgi:hypothetical protein